MPTCQYCHSILSSDSSLKVHQRTVKKCLKIQGIEPDIKYDCDICKKHFSTRVHLQTHISSCLKKSNSLVIEKKYDEQSNQIVDLQKRFGELETKYNMLLEEKKILKHDYDNLLDKITTSAISKTNTNTINKNIVNISTYTRTDDEIKTIYDTNITAEHIEGGISCIAKLIVDKVITDNDGKKMITITDKSRGTARYKLPSGEVIIDIGLNSFTTTNRDMVMKSIYNICRDPIVRDKIFDEDTKLCQGYNEISDDTEGDNLKRNLIKNIG